MRIATLENSRCDSFRCCSCGIHDRVSFTCKSCPSFFVYSPPEYVTSSETRKISQLHPAIVSLFTAAGMQHHTIVSSGRKCFSRNNALLAVFPGSCRRFSSRPTMEPATSIPSIAKRRSPLQQTYPSTRHFAQTIALRRGDHMPAVACTTLTALNPASSKSLCISSLGAGLARRQHISSLGYNHSNQTSAFSLCQRQIRHYTRPRSYTSKLFYDKNGSVVGPKAAGTRVLLLIGAVLVAWFVLNYAIGAAIMMLLKGAWRLVWGSLCWLVYGVYGVLKAIVGS